ncbi:MAG: sugar transferase [Candidatus Doudnabacteria bacterium]
MKRPELIFNLISIPLDILALIAAGIASFYLRYQDQRFITGDLLGPVQFELSFNDFLIILLKVIPVMILIFAFLGLYAQRGSRRFLYEFNKIITGVSISASIVIVLFFFNQSIFPSRFIILSAWILSIVFLLIGRLILKSIQQRLFAKGLGLHKLALVNGYGKEAQVIESILSDKRYGYDVVIELPNDQNLFSQLTPLALDHQIDEIVQANPQADSELNLQLMNFARQHGLGFSYIPNLFEVQRNVIDLNNLKGVPVITLKNTPLDGWGKVTKRIFDIVASLICLIITIPLFIILGIAIKLDSRGPIFYGSIRVGQNKNFVFYKLRSMFTHLSVGDKYGKDQAQELLDQLIDSNDQNRKGPLFKIKDDPRVTRVGRFIRKVKVDEIPQFWNVLKGDMSMVGPRPHIPEQVDQYRATNGRILSIKPGIFGLTQISQITWPTLPFEEEVRLDTYYIENWSIFLDLSILARSLFMLFWAKKPKENY